MSALQFSGGLLAGLVALQQLGPWKTDDDTPAAHNLALVSLGTPLLADPRAIAATMVAVRGAGDVPGVALAVAGLVAALAGPLVCLRFADGVRGLAAA